MHNPNHELPTAQQHMTTTPNGPARYGVGPSKGRSNAASAPGVAEEGLRREGAPEGETTAAVPMRAADEAALRRIARRRARETEQRKKRVDVRYSIDEHTEIRALAQSMGLAGAHLVGAIVMAFIDGDHTLPGQRNAFDDLIDELAALRSEVGYIGHNLNQITKKLNSGDRPHPGDIAVLAAVGDVLDRAGAAAKAIDTTSFQTAVAKAV
ncbi:plasmid mobilization relaxosome protein MobC [Streptomyces sp. NBC_00335]|uniref:plasmid mobilization relaxosome protein MobC n=1 Tax=unclassified Streptomyces TaxID=2593676 RepID=UPI002254117C|nr:MULTISPECIES: plasmid mobilization relaxosome protein MobC [unclassified Streptomyces]MCX5123694.1 plasmid mobilization relaxosome protein MobC [Streptomyces sp. NBC_00347]MCX5405755.1 plasmid mobilization relaxosome protein MobC [Streptomyces sp. NBC_00086]